MVMRLFLAGVMIAATAASAAATTLHFASDAPLKTGERSGIAGDLTVVMRSGEQQMIAVPPDGIIVLDIACSEVGFFRFEPNDEFMERINRGEIDCETAPPVLIMLALSSFGSFANAVQQLPLDGASASTRDEMLQASIEGRHAFAARLANELAADFRARGEAEIASTFTTFAIGAGAVAGPFDFDTAVTFDPRQDLFVTSHEGVRELRDFQRASGIPQTGKWDFRTFRALEAQALGGRPAM